MTVTDSRQGPGTLTLGSLTGAGCQMSNVRLVPNHNEEDGTATLCDPDPAPLLETTWALQGTVVQDWELDGTTGFVEFCRENNGQTVAFDWTPSTALGAGYSGQCQVRAVEIGGDIGVQSTSDFEFPVVGDLTRTDAT